MGFALPITEPAKFSQFASRHQRTNNQVFST